MPTPKLSLVARSLVYLPILLAAVLLGSVTYGQDEAAPVDDPLGIFGNGPPKPIITVTLSKVEGSLEDISWLFSTADRPDMMELIEKFMKDNLRDLKGLDRTRPAGVMLFLQPSLPPRPVPVAYIPVDNVEDLLKTMDLGPLKSRKVEGTENRYEMEGRRDKQHIILRDNYLYISQNEDYATREDLPIPADFAPPVTSKYDLAVTVDIKAVPPLLRDAFLGYLRSQAEADLQRRDMEPEGAYIARRTSGINMLENIEQVLNEGERFTIGLDAAPAQEKVTIDINVEAKPGSDYAEYMQTMIGKPTTFGALIEDESQPLTLAACWVPNKRDRKAYSEYIRALETGLKERFTTADGGTLAPASEATITRLTDPLRSTAEDSEIDMCLQMREVSVGKFVVIAAMRVVGGDTLGTGLQELIARAKEIDPNLDNLEMNISSHQGVNIHRLQGKDAMGDKGPLGDSPSAYIGASGRTAWLAVGGPEALTELELAIDRMVDSAGTAPSGSNAPFKAVFRTSRWLNAAKEEDEGLEIAREAFKESEDAIRVEIRPTDSGARIRLQLDRSFVRFLGLFIARQYDKSQL